MIFAAIQSILKVRDLGWLGGMSITELYRRRCKSVQAIIITDQIVLLLLLFLLFVVVILVKDCVFQFSISFKSGLKRLDLI